ncbi:FAD-binding and (Fe-S)-binding domain-containing protein [Nocardioides taihuensis]|uniref:FAD-binding and (Fe-S)-binding domain-containing protein n=1 Tax=Nocardioides taihuensis TaxID=1835606 RepID=A0ABW0BHQ6_9ACTN
MTGAPPDPATGDLLAELRGRGVTDVDASTLTRALYSSDASLYRVVPRAVARPRHPDEVVAALEAARAVGVPVTARGAGTSIAGNAVGPGLVLDTVRHLGKVLEVDPEARTARVWPGTVHADLQRAAAPYGLRYGPDPSTHTRCTIGGMVGNNACGSRALGYGRTADTVRDLQVVWGTGEVGRAGDGAVGRALVDLVADDLGHVRMHFGRFSRQVSGYALEHLLPERGGRVDRFVVGSEGTLGLALEATVDLVPEEPRTLVVLGYPSMAEAADAVPAILASGPRLVACEGLDHRITDLVASVPPLPRGAGWLFVETTSDTATAAAAVVAAAGALDHRLVDDEREAAALWRIREDGAGLAARSLERPASSGWEDTAVPPEHLGAWLRDLDGLLDEHGLQGVPYGHFGDGCVHVRIDFAFDDGGRRFREFLVAGATALQRYGGSLSGEHGDGRARSELLPLMYDERSLALFAAAKAVADPEGLLNPGVLVDPAPLDADLRPARPGHEPALALRMVDDGGSLAAAVHRCTGVGKCVAPRPGGVMCPSYVATREEKDSTRGRARVLQEALDGTLVHGLDDPAVAEALDLCLGCKGCASDCPTGVDLATYKAEALHQQYRGRRRPRAHHVLGALPRWAALAPPGSGALVRGPVAALAKAVAGVDRRRSLPALARTSARRAAGEPPADVDVWIWADTFTDRFLPQTAAAAVEVLAAAGLRAAVVPEAACCGLTWFTTGQLDEARARVADAVRTLAPYAGRGTVVGLEPSCLAMLRGDAAQLVGGTVEISTLAEVLTRQLEAGAWTPPDLAGVEVVAQPHCHHASVLGWEKDEALLRAAGATVTRVPGCCGLAGSFGMERGHYDVSVAVAESHLLPAVRAAGPGAVVLADGLSCRHQLADLAGVPAQHLAELLARPAQ